MAGGRMKLEDELCLCFHVSKRKVVNYIRIEAPQVASQLSECYGAGTGCGWCRAYLQQLFERMTGQNISLLADGEFDDPAPEQYAADRRKYVQDGRGTPPPDAMPID